MRTSTQIYFSSGKRPSSPWLRSRLLLLCTFFTVFVLVVNGRSSAADKKVESEIEKTAEYAKKTAAEAEKAKELLQEAERTDKEGHEETVKPGLFQRFGKNHHRTVTDEADIKEEHVLSSDKEMQNFMDREGYDTSATDSSHPSVYASVKNGLVSVGDRLAHWFSPGNEKYRDTDLANLADELLKITGVRSKTFADKVEDTLESLHMKTKSPVKEAAEKVAATMPSYETTDELKQKVTDTLEGLSDTTIHTYDQFLKSLHLREKSSIEKAVEAYNQALHEMKVALGSEDRTTMEKINHVFTDTTQSIKDTTNHAYQWLKWSVNPPSATVSPSFFTNARDTWDQVSATTVNSLFRARDTAADAVDTMLKRTGLREEEKSLLQRARKALDERTNQLMITLGYNKPTFWERIRRYAAHPLPASSSSSGISSSSSIRSKLPLHVPGSSAWDSTLKTIGLREKSVYDKAADQYYATLHSLKVTLGAEDPYAGAKYAVFMENQRNRINEILQSMYENMPNLPSGISRISDLPDTVRKQYSTVTKNVQSALDQTRYDIDHSLKALGLKDKTFNERLRDNVTNAFHDFKVAIGMEEPGYIEAIQYATGTKHGFAGNLDQFLKWTGLREKSALEKARDSLNLAGHKFNVALGTENPYYSEKVGQMVVDSQDRLRELSDYVLENVPGGGTIHDLPTAARERYDQLSAGVTASLIHLQDNINEVLKTTGLKERTALEEAQKTLHDSVHAVYRVLGYEDPTMLEKMYSIWHSAMVKIHAHEPTLLEQAQARLHRRSTGDTVFSHPENEHGIRKVWSRVFGGHAA